MPHGVSVIVVNGAKRCNICHETIPLAGFRVFPRGAGGRYSQCKDCEREVKRTYRAAHKAEIAAYDHARRSGNVELARRANELRRANRAANPEPGRAALRAYRAKNPAKVREWHRRWYVAHGAAWNRAWRAANPARERAKNHHRWTSTPRDPAVDQRIAELLTMPCVYCGDDGPIEIDHVTPLSRGGLHVPENLAAACKPCNRSKHNKLVFEWLEVV